MLGVEIFGTIRRLRDEGRTILVVEQDAHAALSIADRGHVVQTGRITLGGDSAALRANPAVQAAHFGM